MSAPRADCRRCQHHDPPSHELSRGWCRAREETIIRLTGRCEVYEGPPLEIQEENRCPAP